MAILVLCLVVVGMVLVIQESAIFLVWANSNKQTTQQLEAMIPQEVNLKVGTGCFRGVT